MGIEGARRLHVGHIHVMQGKVHPQRALWPQNAPSPGAAGVAKRGFPEGILTFFWAGVEVTLAFSGERWGSSGDQRLHTVHIEHAGEMWEPTERPCPLGSLLSGLVRTRVCNPRPFGRQAIWAKDPSGAVIFPRSMCI